MSGSDFAISMTQTVPRLILLLLAVAAAPVMADPAHDLPACPDFDTPGADWSRSEERGFAFALPPGASADPRSIGLDFEFGRWTFASGGQMYFQYGFAVIELAGWLDETFVSGCRASLDGVEAVLLERRDPNGTFAWAIGLFDYVNAYVPDGAPGQGNHPRNNDFVLIGVGPSDEVFAQGRAVFDSFRWSRLPASSLAAWTVDGASNNGVLVFETERGASGMMVATYREGEPYWLVGATPGPIMSYRHEDTVGIPLTLYETRNGVTPGKPDHPAEVVVFADAEFTVSLAEGCTSARLRWQTRSGEITTLHLRPTYPLLAGCSAYGR